MTERLSQYSRVLGSELGPVFASLEDEYFWLELKWKEFLAVFGSPERVAIINKAAPAYFGMLEDVLSDDIIMHIARLTDRGKRKLTVEHLRPLAKRGYPHITVLLDAAKTATSSVRSWRDKRLAHRDLRVALGTGAETLPRIDRDNIQGAIDALHEVVAGVAAHFLGVQFDRNVVEPLGSAESLLYVLRDGTIFRSARIQSAISEDRGDLDWEPLPP